MPLLYRYIFMSQPDPITKTVEEKTFYAASEFEARKQYVEMYGVEPKELVRRVRW